MYQQERTERLTDWLVDMLDSDPTQVADFLRSQQQRRFAVQITVDGLQQGLMQGWLTRVSHLSAKCTAVR